MQKKLLLIVTIAALFIMSGCKTQKIVNKGEAELNQDIHITWIDREVLISNNSSITTYEVGFMGTKPYYSLQAPMKLIPGARWHCIMPDDIVKAVVKTTLPGGKVLMVKLEKTNKQKNKQNRTRRAY